MALMSPTPTSHNSEKNRESLGLNSKTKWPPYRHGYERQERIPTYVNSAQLRIHKQGQR
jgi:hypothetical protein